MRQLFANSRVVKTHSFGYYQFMDMDVICVGNATIDAFVLLKDQKNFNYDKFANSLNFPLGEKIPLDEHILTLGGNACNVSVGLHLYQK
jgi:hypothetical protein